MKSNYTKGVWKQEHRIIDEEGMYATEVFSGDTVICQMHWAGERIGNITHSRREDNAKLIAAAPELLETAISIVNFSEKSFEIYDELRMTVGIGDQILKFKELIKKATE